MSRSKEAGNNFDFSHPPERFKNPKEKEEYYTQLTDLKKGKDTDELIELITDNVAKRGVWVYRIMRDIEKKIPPIIKKDLEKAAKILDYDSHQLLEVLLINPDRKTRQRIAFGQLIASEIDDIAPITGEALKEAATVLGFQTDQLRQFLLNDPNREIELDQGDDYKRTAEEGIIKMHRNTDFPLNILIFFLCEHLRRITYRPHDALISGFLSEQEIMDGREESSILRRRRRYSPKKYEEVYNFYREIYEHALDWDSIFNQEMRRTPVDKPKSEADMMFPSWEDFLSS
jgi:hypothetical protein